MLWQEPPRLIRGRWMDEAQMLAVLLGTAAIFLSVNGLVIRASEPSSPTEQADVKESAGSQQLAFVRVALRDRLMAGDIPDIGIARESGAVQLYVRADLPTSRLVLTADALPEIPDLDLTLITLSEATDLAERTGKRVAFLTVDKVQVGRDSAIVWLGADYVAPEQPGLVKLCCCEGEARFARRNGAWVFEKWGFHRCS